MKKEEFLRNIDEYSRCKYKDEILNSEYFLHKSDDVNNYLFENAFDYSNLNEKIFVGVIIDELAAQNIPIWNEVIYEHIPHMKYKLDEAVLYGNYDEFNELIKGSLFEYKWEFVSNNIEALIKIHYLDLARNLVKNSEIENIEISWDELNELVEQKAEEFCVGDVLVKRVPTEFTEFKEILNIKKTKKQEEILSL
ncbi:hypothetical protein [Mycoplasma anserisalpingitidis]|uniref:hypothetical protein n=1 Tax=Mycoplasma anserisalpingitidis TaxID=519450 RepID=UPI0011B16644|nr:hypothetical protein [Mycoplasma anserisalpingitidis]QDY87731.1 hypothetical protein FOY45_02215 [Mycoplasma anserisalpingitidis]